MIVYVAQSGDTLPSVARRFHLAAEELARSNALGDPVRLTPGLALAVPAESGTLRKEIVVVACASPSLSSGRAEKAAEHASFLCSLPCPLAPGGGPAAPESDALVQAARRQGALPLLGVANLAQDGTFSAALGHAVLSDSRARDAFFAGLLSLLEERGFRGVYLHLMYLYPFDRERLSAFLREAETLLHRHGYLLVTAVPPRESDDAGGPLDAAHDYDALAACSDWVVLASGGRGHAYSDPRPLSPLDGVRRALDHAAARIGPGRLLLGAADCACSWTLPWREGRAASLMSGAAAANLAVASGAEIRYEAQSASSHFRYRDDALERHEVWFEDVRGFLRRGALVKEYGLGGLFRWSADAPSPPLLMAQEELFTAVKLL